MGRSSFHFSFLGQISHTKKNQNLSGRYEERILSFNISFPYHWTIKKKNLSAKNIAVACLKKLSGDLMELKVCKRNKIFWTLYV